LVRRFRGYAQISTTTVSSGQVSDRPETLDRKVSKGCESTGFEETCRSGERRGQETLAEQRALVRGYAQIRSGEGKGLATEWREITERDLRPGTGHRNSAPTGEPTPEALMQRRPTAPTRG